MATERAEEFSNSGAFTNSSGFEAPTVTGYPQSYLGGVSEDHSGATAADIAAYTEPSASGDGVGETLVDSNRLWNLVSDNPQDFNSWTDLLQCCEQEGNLTASRQALNAFLAQYPLCYGYWKKFADLERRAGFNDKAEEVCVRGLKAIPLSVDLWIHYINLLLGTLNMNQPESIQRIRSTFEDAVTAAGWDWHSDRLWDLFAEWEKEQGDLKAVTAVYDRVMQVPTQLYNTHYEKLKTHLKSHALEDLLNPEEYKKLQGENMAIETLSKKEESDPTSAENNGESHGEEDATGSGKYSAKAVEKMQELVLASREIQYQQNEAEVRKRWNYEDAIKRPYFHVKPLDRAQLNAWHSYLDWEIAEAAQGVTEGTSVEGQEDSDVKGNIASHKRVIVLFERCLIACALYEAFWNKYVHYLEPHSLEETRGLYHRACEIHLPYKHNFHMQWAMFEERQGNIIEAQRILEALEHTMPGLAMVRMRRVGLHRRLGHLDKAESLLKVAVEENKDKPYLHAFFSIKLARFLLKLRKDPSQAQSVLQEAIELSPDNSKLYMNLLELELFGDLQLNGGGVQQCVSKALAAPLSSEAKIHFSQIGLQFAEDFGTTVQSLLSIYEEHQKLLSELRGTKRGAENGDDDPEKMSKVDDGSGTMASLQAMPPTMPPPPPPPVGGADMRAYGNYSSWYQQYGGYGAYNPWNQYSQYYPSS